MLSTLTFAANVTSSVVPFDPESRNIAPVVVGVVATALIE
jgi:hypothetical protein